MSEKDKKDEAAELAARSARQAKHSTQNAARAADAATDVVADEAAELAGEAAKKARRINLPGMAAITGDVGVGFFALTVSLYAGAIAFSSFSAAFKGRGRAVK